MSEIYNNIKFSAERNRKLLAVLIDPDKMKLDKVSEFIKKVNQSIATHIFVGGSEVEVFQTEKIAIEIKKHTNLPVVLFPGDVSQITDEADAILFLSLISGRNPDYLIGKHIEAVSKLTHTELEVIPTGYILVHSGKETSVQRVSRTKPLVQNDIYKIVDTAKAGELLGMKLIYLEAGSGASVPVSNKIIFEVKKRLNIPLIVGGGIKSKVDIENAYNSGADLVVLGTAFEENESFFDEIKSSR